MDTLAWLTRLIAFDTTSRNSNLQLINEIQHWCEQHQLITRLTHDPKQPKANLFATLPAHDGNTQRGIILSGHTDVVPVDGQQWDSDPFVASERDGRIYGRGACDMKGFLAVLLALIPSFKQIKLLKPLHFAFSYDEEVGCLGIAYLLADLQKLNINPESCIIGEPTNMRPVIAHKGRQVYRCLIGGLSAHSSLTPHGCNAIEYAARLICYIREVAEKFKQQGPFDHAFDVPFTTLSTNLIKGGIATNTIPEYCEFEFEFRHLPEIEVDTILQLILQHVEQDLLPVMKKEFPQAQIQITNTSGGLGLNTPEEANITQLIRSLTQVQETIKVSYGTEAGLFQHANIPTVICGPGSIKQAHRPNEFVTIEQLKLCEDMMMKVAKSCSSKP